MPRLRIHADGDVLDVDLKRDFNAIDAALFRSQTGMGISEGLLRIYDADVLATFVWLHKRKTDDRLTWEQVAERVTLDDVDRTLARADNAAGQGDQGDQGDDVPEDDPS